MKLAEQSRRLLSYDDNDLDLIIMQWLHNKRHEMDEKKPTDATVHLFNTAQSIANFLGVL